MLTIWIQNKSLQRTIRIWLLPIILTVLLVLQTTLFNYWLQIIPHLYLIRRSAAALGLAALVFGPSVFMRRRGRHIYLFVVTTAIAAIFVSEFLYYRYSSGFLEFSALFYARQTDELWGTISALLSPKLLVFALSPALVIISFFVTRKFPIFDNCKTKFALRKTIAVIIVAAVFLGGYGTVLAAEKNDWGDTTRLYSQLYDLGTLVGKVGVVNFYIEDAVKYIIQSHQQLTQQDKNTVASFVAQRPAATTAVNDVGLLKGRNVFFIQLESFENWVINDNIDGQSVTPTLNSLAKQGMYFPNYYSQIGEGNTADAEFSTLNSLYPLPDTVTFITHPADQNNLNALPNLLKNNGYATAVMHGDVATFWNRSNNYPGLGYENQFSKADYKESRAIGFDGLGDSDFFSQSVPKFQNLKQPFFATVITLSSHTPFVIPSDLQTLSIPAGSTDLNSTLQDYVQSVHYTDAALGTFLDSLKKAGLYDNSLFVIYGDHNAFIGTQDSQTNHVPMIMFAPGSTLVGTNSEPSSHIDLYPTVTNLLGIPAPQTILGQDLLNTQTPVATQRNTGSGTIKFIIGAFLKYTVSDDGNFENGKCQDWPSGTAVTTDNCKSLYEQQNQTIKASDIIVRFNQLSLLTK